MGDTRDETAAPVRVLVADGHELVRAGLAALIRTDPGLCVVAEAGDGLDMVTRAARCRPDVILAELRLPGIDGTEACARVLAAAPEGTAPRVLTITDRATDEEIHAALCAGAAGFLFKDARPRRLLAALHTVAGGDCLLAPAVTRRLLRAQARSGTTAGAPAPDLDRLTPRELEVLRLVATGALNGQIAALLTVTEATVKSHISRAMTKLGLYSRAQAVVLAYESGLVVPRRPAAQET
ncbi:response regulator transcription factor [Streptomyces sp. NPDC046909]|uniref:response regulator transcription factor n=1 Tax=Streptomyces sp. NPDC046909 TaxID=3155617 RepID=UPI0033D3BB21